MANELAIVKDFKDRKTLKQIMLTHHLTIDVLRKKLSFFKGKKNGLCNRGICQTEKDVVFFNKGTSKYYCSNCSFKINSACREHELERLFGKGVKFLCLTDNGDEPRVFWNKQFEEIDEIKTGNCEQCKGKGKLMVLNPKTWVEREKECQKCLGSGEVKNTGKD